MVQKTIFSLSTTAIFFFFASTQKKSHGSPSNINQHTLSESHAKFGAFIRPVTVISLSHLTISLGFQNVSEGFRLLRYLSLQKTSSEQHGNITCEDL